MEASFLYLSLYLFSFYRPFISLVPILVGLSLLHSLEGQFNAAIAFQGAVMRG